MQQRLLKWKKTTDSA